MKGKVKMFNDEKGFGFIALGGRERDHFVHIKGVEGASTLIPGQIVTFEARSGQRAPEAFNVCIIGMQESSSRNQMSGSDVRETGVVKWYRFEKGFGFIAPTNGSKDIFVHYSGIRVVEGARNLSEGQSVSYILEKGPKGPLAVDTIAIS